MQIGIYGTLMRGMERHAALGDSKFLGYFRVDAVDSMMIKTPAGFPAIVRVGTIHYTRNLIDASFRWWNDTHGQDLAERRTGWAGGYDMPLLEMYDISDATRQRLDIIEGVPHLYKRELRDTLAVTMNKVTSVQDVDEYVDTLREGYADFPVAKQYTAHEMDYLDWPSQCEAYVLDPTDDWIQGSEIIWNGDFRDPIINPIVKFDYNEWQAERDNAVGVKGYVRYAGV